MEEKDKSKEEAKVSFTAEQIACIREIVNEQIAKYEKRKLQEARFGVRMPYPPKEHK